MQEFGVFERSTLNLSQGYKYGSNAIPFGDAMKKLLERPQVANFSKQGEVIGKTKGRKKRQPGTEEPLAEDADGAHSDAPPPKRKRGKTPAVAPDAEGKAKGGKKPEVDVPPLETLENVITPPAHVNCGTVYSNSYRKFQALNGKENIEGAKKQAQLASAIFQTHGVVPQELVGKFAEKPRGTRKVATPQPKARGGDAGDQTAESANAEESEIWDLPTLLWWRKFKSSAWQGVQKKMMCLGHITAVRLWAFLSYLRSWAGFLGGFAH